MKNKTKLNILNSKDMYNFGKEIGKHLKSGDVICLNGDLGAGKTYITNAIASGLEIEENITSPTFTIVNEYSGRLKLYHFDVYRVSGPEDMHDIGFEEYIYSDGVSIIEWSNIIENVLPDERVELNIYLGENVEERIVEIEYWGERYKELARELKWTC